MTGDELKQMESLAKRRTAVQQLANSDGWRMFVSAMQSSADLSYRLMVETSNPHDAAKHMGAWHTLQAVLNWPVREMNAINTQAVMLEEEAIRAAKRGG